MVYVEADCLFNGCSVCTYFSSIMVIQGENIYLTDKWDN